MDRFRFFLSCLLSFTAGHITNYSVIIYSQEVLGSEWLSGLGFGLCFGPPLILGWFAGVACDRTSPFKIIHQATSVFVVSNLIFAWQAQQVDLSHRAVWVMVSAFLAGVGWSFVSPARMTALRRVTEAKNMGKSTLFFNVLVMLGFGLGPVCIAWVRSVYDWNVVLSLAASLFVTSSILLVRVRALPEFEGRSNQRSNRTVAGDIHEGLAALKGSRLISELMACALIGFMLMGPLQVLIPKLAVTDWGLGEMGRGALLGVLAPAFIGGGVLCLLLAGRVGPGALIFTALLGATLAFLAIGFQGSPNYVGPLLAIVGVLGGAGQSQIVTLIQTQVDEQVRGRISGIYTLLSQGVPALSGMTAGVLVMGLGPSVSLQAMGVALLALLLIYIIVMKAIRGLR